MLGPPPWRCPVSSPGRADNQQSRTRTTSSGSAPFSPSTSRPATGQALCRATKPKRLIPLTLYHKPDMLLT